MQEKGKILVRFSKELINRWEIEKPMDLSWGRIIVQDSKSFSFTVDVSVEVAEVEAINSRQPILKPGDKVLLSYLVFSQGRYDKNKKPINRLYKEANGDEIFFTNDGTNNWDDSDVYGKITDAGIELLPGFIIIDQPKKIDRIGRIFMPKGYKEDREKTFWCTVLNINDEDKAHYDVGDRILCAGGLSYEIKTGGTSIFIIKPKYVWAKLKTSI